MARKKTEIELRPYDLVLVKWVDAAGARQAEDSDVVPCLSVGWVIQVGKKDGADFIKLAAELLTDDDGENFDTQEHVSIPTGMIRNIVVLKAKHPAPFDLARAKARDD